MFDQVIFREYDIRGIYQKQFDSEFAYLLGKAYVKYFKNEMGNTKKLNVVIGRDARLSGIEIETALTRGLTESGANVIHIGLVTSPISYFTTFEVPDVDGAIMITGSHNPPDYNGFKVSVGKQTIFGEEIQKLKNIILKGEYEKGSGDIKSLNIFPQYLERYKKEFGKISSIKVVLDCGNGAGGCIVRKLYESVGLTPEILFENPDGTFPNHHPDPTVEKNLVHLKDAVLKSGAVVGIGFDGDADRIGVVDHTGKMIYGDELMLIYGRDILRQSKGAKIIGDVKCSDRLFADIKSNGGEPVMWKTGHSLIKEKIKTTKAPFGGEMSGHIFFADRNYGYDDALYASLRLCEILAKTGKTIPELLQGLPEAFNTPEIRLDTTEEKKVTIVQKLKDKFSKPGDYQLNLIDGIRVSFKNGWALARASNTQPVLVLRFEANSKSELEKIQSEFMPIVNDML